MLYTMHPSIVSLLRWFQCDHLPEHLQKVVRPFGQLALTMAKQYEGAEVSAGIRKLLEAKDCAVRAAVLKAETE